MKSWDYYKTVTVPYPNKDEFTDVFVYSKGEVVWKGAYNDFKPFSDGRFKGMLVEKVVNEAGLKQHRLAYGVEQQRLALEFKQDLFEEHRVTGHPKANKCYSIAYDYGHSSGYQEVANYFDTLVDLIKD